MAATSPYTPNDYQAVSNFRPYELPINDIVKAISAQNAFWDAGAAKVKNVYENALNLKLSLEPNKKIRDQYIEDAKKQLTKLSSADLSNPSVQREGFAIFKPLFQDEGIVYDDLTTRHYEKVRNDALSYRGKDNGKQYSDINFQYAMQGYNEFVTSKDRMAGKTAYQKRKDYIPYYDYTEDFSQALKDCPSSSIEGQSPLYNSGKMTGYMRDTVIKGRTAEQVKGCLEAGLSPNAKRQLEIEGSVTYRDRPEVLASDVVTYLSGVSSNYSSQLQGLAAKKETLVKNNTTESKALSDTDRATVIAQIDQQMKALSKELDTTNNSVAKINKGDLTDVLNNFESYSGQLFSYKKIYKKAIASAFEDRKDLYKADPVQLNAINFTQQKYLRDLDFENDKSLLQMRNEHDANMAMLDLMYGGKGKGSGSGGADVFRNPLTGEVTLNPNLMRETGNLNFIPEKDDKVYEKISQQVSDLNEEDLKNDQKVWNRLIERGNLDKDFRETLMKGFNFTNDWESFKAQGNKFKLPDGSIGRINQTPWFKAYQSQNPQDEDIWDWSYNNTIVQTGIKTLDRKIEIAEKQVASQLGGDFVTLSKQNIKDLKPITTSKGKISAAEIQDFLTGNQSRFKIVDNTRIVTTGGSTVKTSVPEYFIDGVKVDLKEAMNSGLEALYNKVSKKNESLNKQLNQTRVDVYGKLGFDREPWYFTDDKGESNVSIALKKILPVDDKGKPLDISILSSDFSGGVKVNIPGIKKGDEKMLDLIRNAGIGTSVEATGDNIITIKGTTHNVIQQAIQNPILKEAAFQLASIGETAAFARTEQGASVADSDIKIPIFHMGQQKEMTIKTYKNGDRPEFRVYIQGAPTSKPQVTASNPYELFEKIGRLPFDLNKPIR